MKVLFAPIHYIYGKNYSSEMISAYEIFTRVLCRFPDSKGISLAKLVEENKNSNQIYKYLTEKPFYPNILDSFKLIYFYTSQTLKLIRDQKFTIIHHIFPFHMGRTFNPLFLFLGNNIKKIIGPVMVSYDSNNDANWLIKIFTILDPLYSKLSEATLNKADHVVALNQIAKSKLISSGISANKISIIPIGIDAKKFSFTPVNKKSKSTINLLTLGYLTKRKGTELVLMALKRIVEKNPNVHLTIIGDGPERQDLSDRVIQFKLQNYVTFSGFVDYKQLENFYQKSHILVSMSRAESWGQVYIDAMACGLPVITSKNDGSNEIINDGKFGYLIEQEDYKTLANKVLNLVNNFELMVRFGKVARQEVENKYDWDKAVIPKFLKLYSK